MMAEDPEQKNNVAEKGEEKAESKESAEEKKALEKIKVGDKEYTPEELERRVRLGEIGVEAEEKYDTKLDRVYPEFTRKSQELKELQKQIDERQEEEAKKKAEKGEELSPEEQKKLIVEEAKKFGLVTKEDFAELFSNFRAAEKLTEDAQDVVLDAQEKYGIETTVKEILEHMRETGIRSPEKALKDKFEEQIDKWKEEQLGKKKGSTLVTEKTSTAGSKEAKEEPITAENYEKALDEALGVS
jgi:hypothetical protein